MDSSSSSVHRVHSEHGRSWFIKLPISCNTHIHAHAIHTQHTQHTHTTYATHTAHTHTQNTQHTQHRHTQSNNTHTTHTSHKHNTHTHTQNIRWKQSLIYLIRLCTPCRALTAKDFQRRKNWILWRTTIFHVLCPCSIRTSVIRALSIFLYVVAL